MNVIAPPPTHPRASFVPYDTLYTPSFYRYFLSLELLILFFSILLLLLLFAYFILFLSHSVTVYLPSLFLWFFFLFYLMTVWIIFYEMMPPPVVDNVEIKMNMFASDGGRVSSEVRAIFYLPISDSRKTTFFLFLFPHRHISVLKLLKCRVSYPSFILFSTERFSLNLLT